MRIFSFTALLFLSISHVAFASIFDMGDLYFKSVADQGNIPDGIITSIAQDQDGFIWLGTQQGAIRYDGYQFRLFKHQANNQHSLAGNYIRSIWVGPENRIWFGTFSDGISVLDPRTNEYQHFDFGQQDKSGNSIRFILGEDPQRVWVATNHGLSFINPYSGKVTHIKRIKGCDDIYAGNGAKSLLLDDKKTLWVGTQSGLCRVNLPTLSYQKDVLVGHAVAPLVGQNINTMVATPSGNIWVGTLQNGAARLDVSTSKLDWIHASPEGLGHPWVVQMALDRQQHLWIGTLDGGISVVNSDNMTITNQIRHDASIDSSINQNNIGAILRDRTGLMWVGTWGAGLNVFNPESHSIRTLRHSPYQKNSLQTARIRAITETDKQQVWVGYSQMGVTIIDTNTAQLRHIKPQPEVPGALQSGDILSLQHTKHGEVWIGTRRDGVQRYDPISNTFFTYPEATEAGLKTVTAFASDDHDRLWIGSTEGVWFVDLADKSLHNTQTYEGYDAIKNKIIYTVAWQAPDALWVGTDDGLFRVATAAAQILEVSETAGTANALSDNAINTLLVDAQNQLWVATENGLDKLLSWNGVEAQFLSIDESLEQPPIYTANIRADTQGRIWHYKGVYDLPNNKPVRLDDNHGWDIGTIWLGAVEQTQDGTILFGGNEGLLLVNPDGFNIWHHKPQLAITQINVDNRASWFDNQHTIALSADNRSFSVEFSSLDFTAPQQAKYAWRLVGFDEDWIHGDANNRRATYTNLPAGNYILEIKGSNRDGGWGDEVTQIKVVQAPQWFAAWWFLILGLITLASVMWWLFILRTAHLVRQKQKLDALVSAQTAQLAEANIDKDRIMSVIAHDINNKISIGLGYLDLLKMETQKHHKTPLSSFVEQAIKAGQDCADLVNELRDYGKLSNESDNIELKTSNLNNAIREAVRSQIPAAAAKNIHLQLKNSSPAAYCLLHKVKFSRIMENLINNAIKFSHEGQPIEVAISLEQQHAVLSVKDVGIGIPEKIRTQLFYAYTRVGRPGTKNEKSTGLGLYIVKKLVAQHKGSVWFESEEDKGTTFFVRLPKMS